MKKLIKRLSHVSQSQKYTMLKWDTQSPHTCKIGGSRTWSTPIPEGYLPVYVGEKMQRYVIKAKLVNHAVFVKLLNLSAQEYGYDGLLRIPCDVTAFERVLEGLRLGNDSVHDLLNFL